MRSLVLLVLLVPNVAWAGASVWVPVRAAVVKAGSAITPDVEETKYGAENAIDDDPTTTFVVEKGHVLRIELGGTPRLHYVELVPGYAKNDKVWRRNRRVTKVRARTFLKGEARPWKTAEIDPPDERPKALVWLGVDLGREVRADAIEIEVLDSEASKVKGRSDDICISDVRLLTFDDEAPSRGAYVYDYRRSPDRMSLPFERFELEGGRCSGHEHENTGGALTTFVGSCSVSMGRMTMKGKLEIEEPGEVSRRPFDGTFSFRRINARLVQVDGHFFRR
ncbi:MAG: hypothetical protein RIT81_14305 [Deltaproteobacteria bacterium]